LSGYRQPFVILDHLAGCGKSAVGISRSATEADERDIVELLAARDVNRGG
jgi:hypothetical protein